MRATGFGWAACVGYDALISAGLAFIIFGLTDALAAALFGPLSMPRRTVLAFLAALLILLFRNPGRPDELGMALGFANAWWLFLPRASSSQLAGVSFSSGVLAGLMLCTSPGVFLAFMPFLTALWLRRMNAMRKIAPSLATAGLGGGLAVVLCLTPLFLAHPYFYRQFFEHVQATGSLNNGFVDRLAGVSVAWHYSRQNVFIMFATVPAFCLGMVTLWRTRRFQEMLAFFVAPLVSFGLVFVLYRSHNYWWFLQPWFLLVAMVVTADFWWNRHSRLLATVAVGWLTICLALASAWPVKNYLVRFTLAPEQELAPNARKLRALIPTGAGVLTANGWWILGGDRSVYDPGSDIQDLARIEYFVTDSNGTGQPGVWDRTDNPRYDAMIRESFEVISDTLPKAPPQFFGLRITNSAYGFGTIVLRRIAPQPR